jgi:hypothetical protein
MKFQERATDAELLAAVASSKSMAEAVRKLGRSSVNPANHTYYKKRALNLGASIDHFESPHLGKAPSALSLTPENLFVRRPPNTARRPAGIMRPALIAAGVPYVCAECKRKPVYRKKPITLQIDHISGDSSDDRRENLRFLCAFCHEQTDTYYHKPEPGATCKKCGGPRYRNALSGCCRQCMTHDPRPNKIDWPEEIALRKMLATMSCEAVARKLGVSSNAIRKHLARLEKKQ